MHALDRNLLDYVQALDMGKRYSPPLSLDGLAKSFRVSPHHSSAIYVKRDILAATFVPRPLQQRFAEVNEWVGEDVVRFRPYVLERQQTGSA